MEFKMHHFILAFTEDLILLTRGIFDSIVLWIDYANGMSVYLYRCMFINSMAYKCKQLYCDCKHLHLTYLWTFTYPKPKRQRIFRWSYSLMKCYQFEMETISFFYSGFIRAQPSVLSLTKSLLPKWAKYLFNKMVFSASTLNVIKSIEISTKCH